MLLWSNTILKLQCEQEGDFHKECASKRKPYISFTRISWELRGIEVVSPAPVKDPAGPSWTDVPRSEPQLSELSTNYAVSLSISSPSQLSATEKQRSLSKGRTEMYVTIH